MVEKMDEKTVLGKVGWLEAAKVSLWDDKIGHLEGTIDGDLVGDLDGCEVENLHG